MHDLIKVLILTYMQWILIYYIDKRMRNKIIISEKEIETVKLIENIH